MRIPMEHFEQVIHEPILSRGMEYFDQGAITDIVELSPGEYEAYVMGTEEYTVQLTIEEDVITTHYCNCPYDMGPVCKHLVAVIFYLQQDIRESEGTEMTTSKKERLRKKSLDEQVQDILGKLSSEELKVFVQEAVKSDRSFRNSFLATFGYLGEEQSKEFYQKQISSTLQSIAGREGYISWSDMYNFGTTFAPFCENAEKLYETRQFENLFYLSTAILEEMTEAFQYADDSSGEIGSHVEFALEMLDKLSAEELPEKLRKQIFDYFITSFKIKTFSDWEWHLDMLSLAQQLITNTEEADTVLYHLDYLSGDYQQERAQVVKLEILKTYRKSEVAKFLEDHLSNSIIRKREIEFAMESRNFEYATHLCHDGIETDKENKPGLAKEWYNWLLKIAQAQNDTVTIIKYARLLFLDDHRISSQDYYQVLKDTIQHSDWKTYVEALINEIKLENNWHDQYRLKDIYIREEYWDRLFAIIQKDPSLTSIETYERYLAKDYAPELVNLYAMGIIEHLQQNMGRKHYRSACKYIRRMKKLGGIKEAAALIEDLRNTYPQRRALMQELNQI